VGEIRVKTVGFQPFSRNYQDSIRYYTMPREKDTFLRLLKKSLGCSYIQKIVAIHLPLEKKALSRMQDRSWELEHVLLGSLAHARVRIVKTTFRFLVREVKMRAGGVYSLCH
jgi:hypothetical protein